METLSKNTKISVDKFYENKKELYDICGNVINNEKYPFVDILSKYLTDIVDLIDIEIKNSVRNSMINWREKKNPKLLSRLINNDDNVNLINMSMNKITSSNFMNIVSEISEALMNDNYRKLPDYCSFLFDVVIKKCMIDEAFSKDYIRFLFGFKDNIAKHLSENIKKFVEESVSFLTTNQSLKEYSYFHYVKDTILWRNVGVIFANIYKFQGNNINIIDNLESQFDIIFNIFDWFPTNMDELNGRLFMVFAIMESLIDEIWDKFKEKYRNLFKEILTLVYNCTNIPNKIKFKVLDLQDVIKNIKVPVAVSVNTSAMVVEKQNEDIKNNTNIKVANPAPITVPNSVNVWEARKQQQVSINLMQNQSITTTPNNITAPSTTVSSNKSQVFISNMKDRNYSHRTSKNENKEEYIQSGTNRNRKSAHRGGGSSNYNRDVIKKVDQDPKRKNMFSGLESGDSNDEHPNEPVVSATINADEDDFITVEKKTKNIYKPKKTPSLAIEGGKIYSNVSSKSGQSNYSKRK